MSIVDHKIMLKLMPVCKSRCLWLLLILALFSFCASGQQGVRQPSSISGMDSWRQMHQLNHPSNLSSQTAFATGQINKKKQQQINSSGKYRPSGNLDCIDTSSRFFIKTDSATFSAGTPVKTADGNLLVSGLYFYDSNGVYVEKGFLMKTDTYGTVLWTKLYDSLNHQAYSFINYYNVIELKDGSILLAGSTNTSGGDFTTTDLIVTKTDNTGNITWSKIYTSRALGAAYNEYFGTQQIKEDPLNGDLYITGPNRRLGYNIIKLSTADGNIIWSKLYQPPFVGYDNMPFGIDIEGTEIYSFGCFQATTGSYINAYRIDKNTGDIINAKYYQVGNSYITPLTFFVPDPLVKLANGNYALSGSLWGYRHYGNGDDNDPYYQSGVVQMDRNLDFVNAYCFRNSVYVDSYTKTTIYPDGSGMCHMIEFLPANFYSQTTHAIQFDNGTIIKQRKAFHSNEGYHKDNGWVKLADGGEMSVLTTYDSINKTSSLLFTKLHLTDTASDCLGINEDITFTEPYQIIFLPDAKVDSIGSNVFQLLPDKVLTAENFISKLQTPACNQIAFCDTFAMKLSTDSVCLFTPVNIQVTKRRVCGSDVLFNFDSSVIQSFVRANDSVYTVIFKAAWRGKIVGSLNGCRLLTDSVLVTVLAPLPILNLGADTLLCSGDKIVLHAGKGYDSYRWQDGSTDSIFTVTKAGTYYVAATNACSGTASDTIVLAAYPDVPFSLGPDTVLCAGNVIVLNGPSGYGQYLWQDGSVDTILRVTTPGIYYLTADNSCTGSFTDTVIVSSHAIIPFDLGAGIVVCANDSIAISAPSGFINYRWSPGYNISGITGRSVVVNPRSDTIYKVTAEKTPGCFVSDSIIVDVKAVPAIYLGADTSICYYSEMVLKPGQTYATYLWSKGNTGSTITIRQPGLYWLQATDAYGCTGKDTIMVLPEHCMKGVFVPTAFSPNRDGKNDEFKPVVFGEVKSFKWIVYNRYGQIVFTSNSVSNGWDGTVKGVRQPAGNFTWVCHYQLTGEVARVKSGSVLLIR